MTLEEALQHIDELGRKRHNTTPVSQKEVLCADTQAAVRVLASAYQQVQKTRSIYGRKANNRLSRAASRACAARMMASGRDLEIPRLAPGSLDPFQPGTGYACAFELARNLLLAGAGIPDDWDECHGDLVQFMLRTVQRAASVFDRRVIDGVAHTNLVLGTTPPPPAGANRSSRIPTVFFSPSRQRTSPSSIPWLEEACRLAGKSFISNRC